MNRDNWCIAEGESKYFYTKPVDFEKEKNVLWVHVIRVAAVVCIIPLHMAFETHVGRGAWGFNWWVKNAYRVIFKVGVPLFFMLSGCTLLNKYDPIPVFFRKRVSKVLFPLFVWSVVYMFWNIYLGKWSLSFELLFFLCRPAYYHLWFLYVLLGLYLYMPILRVIVLYAGDKLLFYFIALWFIRAGFIPLLEYLINRKIQVGLNVVNGPVGFLFLGYLLSRIKVTKKGISLVLYVMFTCICFGAVGKFAQNYIKARPGHYFQNDLSVNNIVLSAAVFLFLKYFSENMHVLKNKRIIKTIEQLSSASFGIYLIHPVTMHIISIQGRWLPHAFESPIYAIPIKIVLVFLFSFITIYTLQKVPIIKRCVP